MAKAKKLPSGQWRALVYSHTDIVDAKKVRRYESFTANKAKEAEYMAAEFKLKRERDRNPLNKTVGETIDEYIDTKTNVLSPSTVRSYKYYRKHHLQKLMPVRLSEVTQTDIQSAVNTEAKLWSPKTVRNLHGLLSATLKEYLPHFELNTVLPQKIKKDIYIPTDNDIAVLLSNCKIDNLRLAIILAYSMGLRRSEICALKVQNIDYTKKLLRIKGAVVLNDDKTWQTKTTKTLASDRVLHIPDVAYAELEKFKGQPIATPLLTYVPSQITDSFKRLVDRCGLPHFRFHDLRHYNASMMLALNIPDKYAMQIMGHSTNNMLKTVYQHTTATKMDDVYEQINQHLNINNK
ncbi:MAG: site-specific integrase [Lachnospiraceae bacterium]|nr:site-specific integrase [Lachnospiraceae bacterium]